MIDKFCIVGSGNTAWQLAHHFVKNEINLSYIVSRNKEKGSALASKLGVAFYSFQDEIPNTTGQFLCVSDQAISVVSTQLRKQAIWQVHCSGSVSINEIKHHNKGVFYPLQTMTESRLLSAESLPICLEWSNDTLGGELSRIANQCDFKWVALNSLQREHIHVSAVMVNNFVNHVLHYANDYAKQNGVDKDIFKPLALETINKAFELGGKVSQTGPAKRGDNLVVEQHLEKLKDNSKIKELYQFISESIKNEFRK